MRDQNPYTRQIAIYFDTLRRVLDMDPHRLSGAIEYATNPDNAEEIVIDVPSIAHPLLAEAAAYGRAITVSNRSERLAMAHTAIDKAEEITAEELQQSGFSYAPLVPRLG